MKNSGRNKGMERRDFIKGAGKLGVVAASGAAGLGWLSPAFAQSAQGYKTLEVPMPTGNAEQVEVLEFFWFGCPHCFAFEPAINKWAASKPDYVDFVREAPPLNPSWEQHSRAFYAAEALQITDGFFDEMFNRIHKDKKPMRNPKRIGQFVESLDLGVDAKSFTKAMSSFAVDTALNRSITRAQQAGISSVPSVLINGKYLTGSSLAGSHQGIINVINERAEAEHKAG